MANVLFVKAHPLTGAQSKTLEVTDVFLNKYTELNPTDTIEVLDLFDSYIPELDNTLLTAMYALGGGTEFSALTADQQKAITRFGELTDQFLAADKIVIANALWNLNIPTKLKAWFDAINVAGKTFRYTETGPVPMTEGKKIVHIQSGGGNYDGADFASQYVKAMMNFVGVMDHTLIPVEGIDHHPEQKEEIMNAAKANAEEVAAKF
ncbi:FMN-dependent NADH-azoreductase [Vagococcus zengguangii]|uniref:FMN dependent NADH:quinone oxidoreductase n=1 Tax=Vagococcus zengguangii TaxID=2571750 RepID=A0A4D7CNV2_9ENTE|nr:FMN-dependent NADH-azoreductase [Vagococcus zengguangii]QCI85765.1 FMN-dependent NADH-azoreductase [Vagococcus zengguangii]TLG81706.1 FMN-dependent NADH-azoreductase [Vagococcus zengguangii]